MKRLIKPISFLFVALSIASCSKNKTGVEIVEESKRPLVDYEVIKGSDAFSYEFKNKSANYKSLEWRFGDDSLSSEDSPKHIYLTTGLFEVNLKGVSETGAMGRKLIKLNIHPDSVVKLTATKTGVANQVKFAIDVKAVVKSVLWTFSDVTPAVTSTDLSPVRTYAAGSFNAFKVKITTDKGSVVTISKFVTSEGIAENITASAVFTPSSNNTNSNENAAKIVDNNLDTKIYLGGVKLPFTLKFAYDVPQTVKIYAIGNANDSESRDPKIWTLEGSNDGNNWTVLDSQNLTTSLYARGGNKYKQLHYFPVANPRPFSIYKWTCTAMWTSTNFQISEFRLFR